MKAFLFFIAILVFISCTNTENNDLKNKELSGSITVSGAFALYPMAVLWKDEFTKLHPKVVIDISAGGAGKGMTDALAGMVDLGMFSREITDAEKQKGVWWISVTKDAVLPTVNGNCVFLPEIQKQGFTCEMFEKIFIVGEVKTWEQALNLTGNTKINVYTRSDACGAAEMWGKFLKKNQESLLGIGIFGDPGIAEAVKSDPLSIGFNNVIYAYDIQTRMKHQGLEIIPIDLNADGVITPDEDFYDCLDSIMHAIEIGKYPSPPARELYFIAKEAPKNQIIKAFLQWILTDGQAFVEKGGYVKLSDEKVKEELEKLN